MAIYHLSAQVISRSEGRSCVAAAAYRSGASLTNAQDGRLHDYSRRRFVAHSEILAPDNVPAWMLDRERLWNAVEAVEKRRDAQLAREIEVSLPRELSADEQRALLRHFVREQFVAKGMIADIAIHNPKASDGQDQPHAHVMLTMRELTGAGFGNKNRDWNGKDQLEGWREAWSACANRALEQQGHAARIDHRTLERQREEAQEQADEERAAELDREPQPKLGVTATGMERRGVASARGEAVRRVVARNAGRRTLREQLCEVSTQIGELMGQMRDHLRGAVDALQDRRARLWDRLGASERDGPDGLPPVGSTARPGDRVSRSDASDRADALRRQAETGDRLRRAMAALEARREPQQESVSRQNGLPRNVPPKNLPQVPADPDATRMPGRADEVRRSAQHGERLRRAMEVAKARDLAAADTAAARRGDGGHAAGIGDETGGGPGTSGRPLCVSRPADEQTDLQRDAHRRQRMFAYPPEMVRRFTITPGPADAGHRVWAGDREVFRDFGDELRTGRAELASVRLMLDLAQYRGWDQIRLDGAQEARRDAWLEASLRGMRVRGYEPTERDRRELDRRQNERDKSERGDEAGEPGQPSTASLATDEIAERLRQQTQDELREAQRRTRDRERER